MKKRKNWTTKYVKLTLNEEGKKIYNQHKFQCRVKRENFWGIVAEDIPGRWEIIYKGHEKFDESLPYPLNEHYGYTPNYKNYDYEELTEEEIFLFKL